MSAATIPFLRGVGLHTGEEVAARLVPAPRGAGLRVVRTDLGVELAVVPQNVRPRERCTCIEGGGARVETVEHALAALVGLGIADAVLEVDGPEVPQLDGSALPWVLAARAAGLTPSDRRRRLERAFELRDGDRVLRLAPGPDVDVRSTIDFAHPAIGRASVRWAGDPEDFVNRLAPARTFALLEDVEALYAAGRIRGGTLDAAVVLGPDGPLNPEGLRFPDEPARHKLLDLLGDLALLGGAPRGRVEAERYGHGMMARAAGAV
jgi:UDP-3-O-[3-hydroxymyristoyl] N-acetylglucosamine deacetylase